MQGILHYYSNTITCKDELSIGTTAAKKKIIYKSQQQQIGCFHFGWYYYILLYISALVFREQGRELRPWSKFGLEGLDSGGKKGNTGSLMEVMYHSSLESTLRQRLYRLYRSFPATEKSPSSPLPCPRIIHSHRKWCYFPLESMSLYF